MFFAASQLLTSSTAAKSEKDDSDEDKSGDEDENKGLKTEPVVYKPLNEREAMQEKTFRKWMNLQLKKADASPVNDLFRDLKDGRKLLVLLEILSGEKLPREKGRMRTHSLNNINRVLQFLQDKNVKLDKVNGNDIVDGNPKATLTLVWAIIQHCWTNYLEEESLNFKQLTLEQALLRWCRQITRGYENVDIRNFTTCWRDGFAFNAIIHSHRPDLMNFSTLRLNSVDERLINAFKMAETHFFVQPLLEPEDVNSDHIDKKSLIIYVMSLFQALPHDRQILVQLSFTESPIRETGPTLAPVDPRLSQRRASSPAAAAIKAPKIMPHEAMAMGMTSKLSGDKLKDYQACLEDVLTWLLDAEETLQSMVPIEQSDLSTVKQQFKEHEDFMVNLTRNQGSIGDALQQASGLIDGTQLNSDEKEAVRKQMYLLNDKWETIREGAMKRQSKLQERLTTLQHLQLEEMTKWLASIDHIINKVEPISTDPETVKKQLEMHMSLQREIEKQQPLVNSLANIIIVVDESTQGDQTYASLEEKLKEIGKRWHSVCQWVDKRVTRLDSLEKILRFLSEGGRHFADWLDQREAALASLKSAHHLASPKEVLEQVQNLQAMQQDLESEHPRFVKFSQLSSEAASLLESDNPIGAASVRRLHDEVSQRWENLVCRMDEQSSILVRSGKVDPKKIKLPKICFTENITTEKEVDGALVRKTTSIVTVKKYVDLDQQAENAKKLKSQMAVSSDMLSSFDKVFNDFCRWLDKIEASLALSFEDLSHKDQLISLEQYENDVKAHENLLETLHNMGHRVAEQIRADGGNAEEIESRLHDVNSRWRDLCLLLAERSRKIQIRTEAEHFTSDLQQTEDAVNALYEWVNNFDATPVSSVEKLRSGLNECQNKLEIVKQKEPQVEGLHTRLTKLADLSSRDDEEIRVLQRRFDRFTEKWAHVVERISGALETLTSSLEKAHSPNIEEALTSLNDWLDTAEDIIATQDLDSLDSIDVTQMKIERLKELQNQLFVQRDTLNFICSTAEELVAEKAVGFEALSVQLVNLAPRWADIERVLKSQLTRLESGYVKLKDWDRKANELDKWIDQVTDFVHAEQPAVGNLETLKAQLEQSQGLNNDIETLRPKLQQVESTIEELSAQCTPEMKDYLKKRMDELDKRWTDVTRLTKAKHDGLHDVYSRSQRVFDDIQQLTTWLTSVEEELNSPVDPGSGKDLQTLIKRHKQLRDELQSRSETVEAAVCLGEEMVGSLEGSPEAAQQLQIQLNTTRNQWSAICQHVHDKLQNLTDAFEEWKELQELLAAEKICLDQLERKLNEPMKSAADAEEYSEQLDLLERLMEGGGGRSKILQTVNSLMSKNILTNAVSVELAKYDARRDQLLEPAKERQHFLESGVHESQEFEQQLLNCQSWVSHVDYILSARLSSDILASDVPQEYKQLQSEFEEHEECIKNLENQVAVYRNSGKAEAANRLEEQVNHVKKQMLEIKPKFERFKKPNNMDTILERLWKVSKEIEQSIFVLRVTSDNIADIETQIDKSQQIHQTLMEMKSELDEVIINGRTMIEGKQVENPEQLNTQLNDINSRYSTLGTKLNECKSELSRALSIIKRLNDNINELERFLNKADSDLSKFEMLDSSKAAEELGQVEDILRHVKNRESDFVVDFGTLVAEWTGLSEGEESSGAIANRVQAAKKRLQHTKERVSRLLDKLKSEPPKETKLLKNDFNMLVAEVGVWLDSTELSLHELVSDEETTEEMQETILKGVQLEVNQVRPKINRLRDLAVEFMSQSDEEGKQDIENDLTLINTRWENILSQTKEQQRRLRIPSLSPTPALFYSATSPRKSTSTTEESKTAVLMTSPTATVPPKKISPVPTPVAEIQESKKPRPMPSPRLKRAQEFIKEPTPDELAALGAHAAVLDNVESAKTALNDVANSLAQNVTSVEDVEKQLKDTQNLLKIANENVLQLKSKGQSLAEMGPRELIAQRILDDIDSVAENQRKLEKQFEKQKELTSQLVPEYTKYGNDVDKTLSWLENVNRRLSQAGDQATLKAAQDEFASHAQDLENLRSKSTNFQRKLSKFQSSPSFDEKFKSEKPSESIQDFKNYDPKFNRLQEKWREAQNRFDNLKKEQESKQRKEEINAFLDTVAALEKMLTAVDSKVAASKTLRLADYMCFMSQDELLKTIREHIEAVESNLSKLEERKDSVLSAAKMDGDPVKIEMVMNSLRAHLTQLNAAYNERVKLYESTLDNWQVFHKNANSVISSLDQTDNQLNEYKKLTDIDLDKAESLQKDLEKSLYQKEGELKAANHVGEELLKTTSTVDTNLLKERLEFLNKRFHMTAAQIAERRESLEQRRDNTTELRDDIDELLFWLDESEALLATSVDPTDQNSLADLSDRCKEKYTEIDDKIKKVNDIEKLANSFVQSTKVPEAIKEGVMMDVNELQDRLRNAESELQKRSEKMDEKLKKCAHFWHKSDELSKWANSTKKMLEQYQSAIIYTPTHVDTAALEKEISVKQTEMDKISQTFAQFREEARRKGLTLGERGESAVQNLLNDWAQVLNLVVVMKSSSSSSSDTTSDRDSKLATDEGLEIDPSKVKAYAMESAVSYTVIQKDRKKTVQLADKPETVTISLSSLNKDADSDLKEQEIVKGAATVAATDIVQQLFSISSDEDQQQPKRGSVLKSPELMKDLTQMKHWLNDAQRENSGTIDVIDQGSIKSCLRKQQIFSDNLASKRLQLIRILENARNSEIQHKAEILSRDWDRCLDQVNNRKKELNQMLEDSRFWDNLKSELEIWLHGTQQKIAGKKVSECSVQELHKELINIDRIMPELDIYKIKMTELNEASNRLIDSYPNDDSTMVSQVTSDLNTHWTKLNDNVRVRRAVLEASLRGRNDFETALDEFLAWLNKIEQLVHLLDRDTSNTQLIKDANYRRAWMEKEKDLRAEKDAHEDILRSLRENGSTLASSLEKTEDRRDMENRLQQIDRRWDVLVEKLGGVRGRLSSAQEQWERLTGQLQDLLSWIKEKNHTLLDQNKMGGDLDRVKQQKSFCQKLRRELDEKEMQINDVSKLADSFLRQQDMRSLRPSESPSREESDEKLTDEEENVRKDSMRVAQQIKNQAAQLKERWPELLDRCHRWEKIVDDSFKKMAAFDEAIQRCEQDLSESEMRKRQWTLVKDVKLDDLPNQMDLAKSYQENVAHDLHARVDDVNDHSAQLLANNVPISPEMIELIEALNTRYKQLDLAVAHRLTALENALRDFGPSSQHFLQCSVLPPWQRAISANRIPYYINLETEKTQWDHPKMVDMMMKLCEFNDVKFSAYRTGMKLRAVQKRLFLDLLNLHDAVAIFSQKKLIGVNDRVMDISEIIMTLLPIYENIYRNHQDLLKSLPLAIDLCLNWLLNIFDPVRTGLLRALSFKVALTLLCRATIEEKYKFLFRQVCSPAGGLDKNKLALLIHDCVQIPKYLGEVASFGGTNVEPSVRSCFEQAKYPQEVSMQNYLDWLKCEPQSLVWLPVMHRVAAAETAKHQSKCNICKMFPIVGLRYRCLKCFNFDMCQNCFFSQRVAKSHKVTHPMQEYCSSATSGEDVRDFGKVVKNKFKRKRYWKSHPRLGYLPVQTVAEGPMIETRNVPPFNPLTQELHQNVESFCSRLTDIDKSQTFSVTNSGGIDDTFSDDEHLAIANLTSSLGPDSSPILAPRSPAQLVSLMESVQRDEFENIKRRLEEENKRLELERDQLQSTILANGISPSATMQSSSTPQLVMTNGSLGRRGGPSGTGTYRSTGQPSTVTSPMIQSTTSMSPAPPPTPLHHAASIGAGVMEEQEITEEQLATEAKALRQHKDRLEERSKVLEDHNRQLEVQLKRLKHLIDQQQLSEFSSSMASQQSTPYATPVSSLQRKFQFPNGHIEEGLPVYEGDVRPAVAANRMGDLMSTAQDLGKAMGNLVNAVTSDDELSAEEEEEEEEP